jgi:predicted helicase
VKGGAKQEEQGERPIFKDFTEPATKAGAGVHIKNLYNDYVYFWRWALWRLFEQQNRGGIVTFITASSYLAGPGFIGMREVMRRTFDELWVVDLGGDNLGTRKSPNVFNIQTPVAIAIGVRGTKGSRDSLAKIHYAKIEGATRAAKLTQLKDTSSFKALQWKDCEKGIDAPFLPVGTGDFFDWPRLIDIFPYQRSGSKFGRSWPIGHKI